MLLFFVCVISCCWLGTQCWVVRPRLMSCSATVSARNPITIRKNLISSGQTTSLFALPATDKHFDTFNGTIPGNSSNGRQWSLSKLLGVSDWPIPPQRLTLRERLLFYFSLCWTRPRLLVRPLLPALLLSLSLSLRRIPPRATATAAAQEVPISTVLRLLNEAPQSLQALRVGRHALHFVLQGRPYFSRTPPAQLPASLLRSLLRAQVPFAAEAGPSSSGVLALVLSLAAPLAVSAGLAIWAARLFRNAGQDTAPLGHRTGQPSAAPTLSWPDIAGLHEAKQAVRELVTVTEPERVRREQLGVRMPSNALLVGPPGTGKVSYSLTHSHALALFPTHFCPYCRHCWQRWRRPNQVVRSSRSRRASLWSCLWAEGPPGCASCLRTRLLLLRRCCLSTSSTASGGLVAVRFRRCHNRRTASRRVL
jgi:hypothetical protein